MRPWPTAPPLHPTIIIRPSVTRLRRGRPAAPTVPAGGASRR